MGKFKAILSLVLALAIMLSITAGLNTNVFAAENTAEQLEEAQATQATQETQPATEETQPVTVETSEGSTEVSTDTTEVTQATDTVLNVKVGKVKKLYKNTSYTTKIKIYWDAVDGVDGYRIYYKNNDKDKNYSLLTTTKGTSATVKNLPHTTPFQFKVTAYVTKYGRIYEGEGAVGKTATEPATMKAPTLKRSSTLIQISWSKNSRADGYRIYRQDSTTNGKLVLYKTIKKNSTLTFTDKNVKAGKAYNYQVRAYREMYKGKTYVGKGTTLCTVAGLCSPGLVSATSQLRRISLVWNKNAQAQGYDIYCKADDQSSYKLLGSTKNTYYNTKRLRAGHTYTIKIKPYKLVGAKKTKVYGTYRTVTKKAVSTAYGEKIGNTYIEISIKQQRMWFYIDGELYVETPVVTGNVGAYSTPTGSYKIWQRQSPATLTGPTWSSYVTYWLAFTYSGCGIHDASWRSASEYGGTTYMGNGSHGCVNTPYSAVKKIYSKAKIGTNVVVY